MTPPPGPASASFGYTPTAARPLRMGGCGSIHAHPSGTRHIHVTIPQPAFGLAIVVATPPPDSTGLPHALEHLVGCGSRRFPARQAFYASMQRSASMFFNGLTYADHTIYTFATRHERDFHNLLDVMWDGVLHPLLQRPALLQEVCRCGRHADSGEAELSGVMLSEMRGESRTPEHLLERGILSVLFPGSYYQHDSAGAPQSIPFVSLHGARRYHRTYYRPPNMTTVACGPFSADTVLARLAPDLPPAAAPPCGPDGDLLPGGGEAEVPAPPGCAPSEVVAWAGPPPADLITVLALDVIVDLLAGPPTAPVRAAMPGTDASVLDGIHTGYRRSVIVIGVHDSSATADVPQRVTGAVRDTPLDLDRLRASLARVRARWLSTGPDPRSAWPYPVPLLVRIGGAARHGADPLDVADATPLLDDLERRLTPSATGFWDAVAGRWLRDNGNRVTVRLRPLAGFDAVRHAAERTTAERLAGRSGDRLAARIDSEQRLLLAWQQAPSGVESLPRLDPADLTPAAAAAPPHARHLGMPGGAHQGAVLSQPGTALTHMVTQAGTEITHEGVRDGDLWILGDLLLGQGSAWNRPDPPLQAHDGHWRPSTRRKADRSYGVIISRRLITAGEPDARLIRRLTSLLGTPRGPLLPADLSRSALQHTVRRSAERAREDFLRRPMWHAAVWAASHLSAHTQTVASIEGISAYRALHRLAAQFCADDEKRLRQLISRYALSGSVTVVCMPGEGPAGHALRGDPSAPEPDGPGPYTPPTRPGRALQVIAEAGVPTCHVRAYPLPPPSHPDTAALLVAAAYLRPILHRLIREAGAAYGAGAFADVSAGVLALWSFRDSAGGKAFDAFTAAAGELDQVRDDPDLAAAIVRAHTSLASSLSAADAAAEDWIDQFRGHGSLRSLCLRVSKVTASELISVVGRRLDGHQDVSLVDREPAA